MTDILKLEGNVVTSALTDKIFLFHGAPGTWKTTVATGDKENTLLLAYEVGYKFIPGIRAINLTNWHGLKDVIRQLDNPTAREEYKTIVIDTIGLAYKACMAYICAREGVTAIGKIPYGQGYAMAKNEFEKAMHTIPQLGYGLIMIAHSDEMYDENNGISIKVDIDKRPSSVIKGMADFILYARREKMDGDSDETAVYAYSDSTNSNIEVKSRARFFPKRLLFTYENLTNALSEAIKKQNEFFGVESVEEANFDVYKETEIDLESLQNEVVALAQELLQTPHADAVGRILTNELKGVRVTETARVHVPSLFAARDQLIDIKKKM